MDTGKILSGAELVARGVTKINATLPESGQKDISSNGTWLENKQIQSALDARRHLLEVERIEKLGSLSIAIWRDDLRLAEVIKKAGSHWQYIGHNVGKHLYLRPEETLYLIEINSLYLKHNEVVVSLQKAYTLCLEEINIAQYKVYASLSRLGYRVFRHRNNLTQNIEVNTDNSKSLNINEHSKSKEKELTKECTKSNEESPLKNIMHEDSVSNKIVNYSFNTNCNTSDLSQNITDDNENVNENHNETGTSKGKSNVGTTNSTTNKIFTEKNKEIVVKVTKPHNGSEFIESQSENIVNSSENNAYIKDITPITEDTEKPAIVLDYSPINNTPSTVEVMDIDIETNKPSEKPNVHKTETPKDKIDKNTIQNTVIVTRKNKEPNDTGKCANISKHIDKSIEIKNITTEKANTLNGTPTVIVSTRKNGNASENKLRNCVDLDPPQENVRRPDIIYSVDLTGVIRVLEPDIPMEIENDDAAENCHKDETSNQNNGIDNMEMYLMNKMQKLQDRRNQIKPQNPNKSETLTFPDCFDRKVITLNSPHVQYLPRNIFLMKTTYMLDLEGIKRLNSKNRKDSTTESSDGDIEPRRLPVAGLPGPSNTNFQGQSRPRNYREVIINPPMYPMYPMYFRPPIWCPRPPMLYNNYVRPRFPVFPNFHMNQYSRPRFNESSQRKQGNPRFKAYHLRVIKKLAEKFKLVYAPNHIQDLLRLVNTFNEQYDEKYQLTDDFRLIDLKVREVIVLEDDGEPKSKKARYIDDNETINKHLEKLKSLAVKLKELEAKKLAISRHRRVLSNAIKTFNKNFNADIYLNSNFEIIDSKLITLDSSSDSDSVIAVEQTKRKRLRNPFSMMKHLGRINEGASTSRVPVLKQLSLNAINDGINTETVAQITGEGLLKYFQNAWLPSEDDFGHAEVCSKEEAYFFDLIEAEYLYAYFKYKTVYFENWLDMKIAFMEQVHDRMKASKAHENMALSDRNQPLVGPDCTGMMSVLEKLQIIPSTMNATSNSGSCPIEVDFDVYYGNSPHFRKANRPKPNFRVLCIDVSEDLLSSQHIDALCSKYTQDNVPLMLGAVGTGSISYIQVNNSDIPVYIPDNFF